MAGSLLMWIVGGGREDGCEERLPGEKGHGKIGGLVRCAGRDREVVGHDLLIITPGGRECDGL